MVLVPWIVVVHLPRLSCVCRGPVDVLVSWARGRSGLIKPTRRRMVAGVSHHVPAGLPEVGGPVVHQAAPTLEEITARVGRLGGVLRMGRGLDHLRGLYRSSVPRPSGKRGLDGGDPRGGAWLRRLVPFRGPVRRIMHSTGRLPMRHTAA